LQVGTVIKSTGSWYQVRLEDDSVVDSRIIGKFRLNGMKVTNPVAVGDKVRLEIGQDGKGLIKVIEDRVNYVVRQSPRKSMICIY
jgi:ribosome biogenesis GTPase